MYCSVQAIAGTNAHTHTSHLVLRHGWLLLNYDDDDDDDDNDDGEERISVIVLVVEVSFLQTLNLTISVNNGHIKHHFMVLVNGTRYIGGHLVGLVWYVKIVISAYCLKNASRLTIDQNWLMKLL